MKITIWEEQLRGESRPILTQKKDLNDLMSKPYKVVDQKKRFLSLRSIFSCQSDEDSAVHGNLQGGKEQWVGTVVDSSKSITLMLTLINSRT